MWVGFVSIPGAAGRSPMGPAQMETRHDLASAATAILLMVGVAVWLAAFDHPYAAAFVGLVAVAAIVVLVTSRARNNQDQPSELHHVTVSQRRFR